MKKDLYKESIFSFNFKEKVKICFFIQKIEEYDELRILVIVIYMFIYKEYSIYIYFLSDYLLYWFLIKVQDSLLICVLI